jgi:hypothetical protein
MKRMVAIVCLIFVLTTVCAARSSSATAPALSGKMLQLQYLVGNWSCSDTMYHMGNNMPAFTRTNTVSYRAMWGGTIAYNFSSPDFAAGGFYGYLDSKKLWWNSAADNHGGVFLGTGKGGPNLVLTGTGTVYDGSSTHQRDIVTKVSGTKYMERVEIESNSKWVVFVDSTCSKS